MRSKALAAGVIWTAFVGFITILRLLEAGPSLMPILAVIILALAGFFAWRWAIQRIY